MRKQPGVILIIRDGWGYRMARKKNAIAQAATPFTDKIMKECPNVLLNASGEAVGLPRGYQGNSEVGHMTIGSGRVIFQSLERINKSITEGDFFKIPEFIKAIENCRKNRATLHLIGLLQIEGVHSHRDHLYALLDLCKKMSFKDVVIHVITDGRDAPVSDSEKHIAALARRLASLGFGRVATVSGRYYAMDRDKRWKRTRLAYECIVNAKAGEGFTDALMLVKECHKRKETDEFIKPRKAVWYAGVKPKDSIIYYNFRTDRTRQLTMAIVEKDFKGWERKPLHVYFVAMTQFYLPMKAQVAFKDVSIRNLLGEVISKHGLLQLRISETEKYAHVTFFFNGQKEKPFPGEDRILIHSPRVATYDLKPEMGVHEIARKLASNIRTGKYKFIVTNLVNGDMVGHTGISKAIRKAVQAVDAAAARIVEAGLDQGYTVLLFADHGNAEDQTPKWSTSHTINPVPFAIISGKPDLRHCGLKKGKGLQDIAPTVLDILGINQPKEMTGVSLIARSGKRQI